MMINKFASPNKDLVVKPTNCKQCKKALTEESLMIREHAQWAINTIKSR